VETECIVQRSALMITRVTTGYDISYAASGHTQIVFTPKLRKFCVNRKLSIVSETSNKY
jgi:hypothetical protein